MPPFPFVEREIPSTADMDVAAVDFVAALEKMPSTAGATIIGLSGELGAGKTTFTQAVAKVLHITETVTSPTFVIEKIYSIPTGAKSRFRQLIHIDAYRLESPSELTHLGFAAISADPTNLMLIEWPERLGELMPRTAPHIGFKHINETTRQIVLQ